MSPATVRGDAPPIDGVIARAVTVPLDTPESDGTLTWDATTMVIAEVAAGDTIGLGYTYAAPAASSIITDLLAPVIRGQDPHAIGASWAAMIHSVRNQGRSGVVASALSAVDIALWDLDAKLLGVSVADRIGRVHDSVPAYGSGGFTSLTVPELVEQLTGWVGLGLGAVKMKVGRDPAADSGRVAAVRRAVGDDIALFVDANGAHPVEEALEQAARFADSGVVWFEEPVSSDDLVGLRQVRERVPPGMEVTAGEYGYDLPYFLRMLAAESVDCLQADVTRCGGISAFLRVGGLADAHQRQLSAHTAPQVSAHACAGIWHLRHLEYFADHVRVEQQLFDGVLEPVDGALHPDPDRPGLGIELKPAEVERFRTA